ncbi:hypothetical protein TGAM01_v206641 [Trichoderma gamsii]|uniref:UBZ4-type domain-containing protein n=1 Tax=Trichoderma gamsii TaxID=398673 RepID=A0A2P4ZJ33_9HYPO|nr:hypothetical protein TGAM01_v206641 [Trichoderma gamsii]PON24309.1 hypothetical protein TGAM01_v206641 [Trichoderma gamsii]
MNRPRNRQPRPSGQGESRGRGRGRGTGRGRGASSNLGHRAPGTPQQAAGTVPTFKQVVAGAAVFIVLKQDQPTGRETQGVVQDVLTSGDHPRGIKVRLRNGQVGRVQRLDDGASEPSARTAMASNASSSRFSSRYTDIRNDEDFDYLEGPPPRSLADYLPALDEPAANASLSDDGGARIVEDIVVCPICEAFEGDEAAVTHHLDREHLS